jgi:tetratricopeptide (TPR) repeat protein
VTPHRRRPEDLEALTARAIGLAERHECTGGACGLRAAVGLFREVVRTAGPANPELPRYTDNLGVALLDVYEEHGFSGDLGEAIVCAREATRHRRTPHPQRPLHLSNLCNVALTSFGGSKDPAFLDEAVAAGTESVDRASPDDPDLVLYRSNLTAARTQKFELLANRSRATVEQVLRTGRADLLGSAIADGRAAVEALHGADPRRWTALSNTSHALRLRYEAVGEDADLDAAVELARAALLIAREIPAPRQAVPQEGTGDEAREPPVFSGLVNLGAALMTRFFATGSPRDADEAVVLCRESAGLAPNGGGRRAVALSNLAGILQARSGLPGRADTAVHKDLDASVTACREAVLNAGEPMERAVYRANLANALLARGESSADLEEAIRSAGQAVSELPDGAQEWAQAAANLATGLSTRWAADSRERDVTDACGHWRAVVSAVTVAAPVRAAAARDASALAARAGHERVSLGFAFDAVNLLPLLAWRGLRWRSRAGRLARLPALATDGASAAMRCARPEEAVILAEQGRGVLWGQLLDLRGDLGTLASLAPALAARLTEIRGELDRPQEM